jgi:hypothetical protein
MTAVHYGLHLGSVVLAVAALLIIVLCVVAARSFMRRVRRLRQQS